jgi:hypothetical protein
MSSRGDTARVLGQLSDVVAHEQGIGGSGNSAARLDPDLEALIESLDLSALSPS